MHGSRPFNDSSNPNPLGWPRILSAGAAPTLLTMAVNVSQGGGGLLKTQVVKIDHNDFLTDTSTDNQTVTVLQDPVNGRHQVAVYGAHFYTVTPWVGATITMTMGAGGDANGLLANTSNFQRVATGGNGALAKWTSTITPTTQGSNTGTAGAGLSLIGNTSTIDQSAALMNDLEALREDIAALDTKLDGAPPSVFPYTAEVGTLGDAINVTVGTDTAWSSITAGKTYAVLVYIDFEELL